MTDTSPERISRQTNIGELAAMTDPTLQSDWLVAEALALASDDHDRARLAVVAGPGHPLGQEVFDSLQNSDTRGVSNRWALTNLARIPAPYAEAAWESVVTAALNARYDRERPYLAPKHNRVHELENSVVGQPDTHLDRVMVAYSPRQPGPTQLPGREDILVATGIQYAQNSNRETASAVRTQLNREGRRHQAQRITLALVEYYAAGEHNSHADFEVGQLSDYYLPHGLLKLHKYRRSNARGSKPAEDTPLTLAMDAGFTQHWDDYSMSQKFEVIEDFVTAGDFARAGRYANNLIPSRRTYIPQHERISRVETITHVAQRQAETDIRGARRLLHMLERETIATLSAAGEEAAALCEDPAQAEAYETLQRHQDYLRNELDLITAHHIALLVHGRTPQAAIAALETTQYWGEIRTLRVSTPTVLWRLPMPDAIAL